MKQLRNLLFHLGLILFLVASFLDASFIAQQIIVAVGVLVFVNFSLKAVDIHLTNRKVQQLKADLDPIPVQYQEPAIIAMNEFNSPDDAFHYFREHGYSAQGDWVLNDTETEAVLASPDGRFHAFILAAGEYPSVTIQYKSRRDKLTPVRQLDWAAAPRGADMDPLLYASLWAEWHLVDITHQPAA